MAEPPNEDVPGLVERFADHLERLITLLGFFRSVSDDDDTPTYPGLPGYMSHVVRLAFEDTDMAYWYLRMALPSDWDIGRHGAIFAGIELYHLALSEPIDRWRIKIQVIRDEESGTDRVGLSFPTFFMVRTPARHDWIRPRELALMRDALSLIRLGIDARPSRGSKEDVNSTPVHEYGDVQLYGPARPPIVLGVTKTKVLTTVEYQTVERLVLARGAVLRMKQVKPEGGSALNILRKLRRKDPEWNRVLAMSGTNKEGYRIRVPPLDEPDEQFGKRPRHE